MDRSLVLALAELVLAVHVGIILFNVFGLVVVPIGGCRGWNFVRGFWWRLLHLVAMAMVVLQAALGRACFLTLWQDDLARTGTRTPLIMGWVNRLVFWPLPLWVFAAGYAVLFAYVVALLWWVPPRWPGRTGPRGVR